MWLFPSFQVLNTFKAVVQLLLTSKLAGAALTFIPHSVFLTHSYFAHCMLHRTHTAVTAEFEGITNEIFWLFSGCFFAIATVWCWCRCILQVSCFPEHLLLLLFELICFSFSMYSWQLIFNCCNYRDLCKVLIWVCFFQGCWLKKLVPCNSLISFHESVYFWQNL